MHHLGEKNQEYTNHLFLPDPKENYLYLLSFLTDGDLNRCSKTMLPNQPLNISIN